MSVNFAYGTLRFAQGTVPPQAYFVDYCHQDARAGFGAVVTSDLEKLVGVFSVALSPVALFFEDRQVKL